MTLTCAFGLSLLRKTVKVRLDVGTRLRSIGEFSIIRNGVIPEEDDLNCDVVSECQISLNA